MTGTLGTCKRLLVTFARPYTRRLAVGILAGCVAGGSVFGILSVAPELVRLLESRYLPVAESTRTPDASPAAEPDVAPALPGPAERPGKVGRQLKVLERIASRYSIPLPGADSTLTWQFMLLVIGAMFLMFVLKASATFINRYCLRWVGARVVVDLRNALFDTLQKQSLKFYGKSDVGRLIGRCTYDAGVIETSIATVVADLTRAPVEILAAATYVVWTAVEQDVGLLVLVMMLIFPTVVLPIVVLGRRVKRYARRALERISDLVSRMQENFTGIRVVKAYNMEEAEAARFKDMNRQYFRAEIGAVRAELFMTPLMELAGMACAGVLLLLCFVKGVRLDQILPLGAAGVLCYRPVKELAKLNVSLQRMGAAGERLFALLDTDTSLPRAANPVIVDEFKDRIVLEHVTFRYDDPGPGVLSDICLEIPRGTVAAFVGETGCGKTTIANLIARFYDPVEGRVLLDGRDLREVEIKSLYRQIGIVTQETILFNDTIANNIRYGTPNATMEQIVAAAQQANAHEFILREQGGYDRVVGEKGFVLSGGQRQRIAIARAILKNPPILILDEATSALDTATEQQVQEAINRVMASRTVIAIAHRLSTIRNAHQIFVLDRGRIAEHGTHQQLYDMKGAYRRLCDMQVS